MKRRDLREVSFMRHGSPPRDPGACFRVESTVLEDERLSWDAVGVFCMIRALQQQDGQPADWIPTIEYLARHTADPPAIIAQGLRELRELGYLSAEAAP
jgi:hypothetical protein